MLTAATDDGDKLIRLPKQHLVHDPHIGDDYTAALETIWPRAAMAALMPLT